MTSIRWSFLLSIAFLLLSLVVPCNSCGTLAVVDYSYSVGGVVHGEIAQRCKYLFALQNDVLNNTEAKTFHARVAQWLQKYEGSVLAGSFMPDW